MFHGGSSLRKFSKKSKKLQSSKNAFNGFPKCPNVFWTSFGAMFLKFFFAQCSLESSKVFEKINDISKLQKCPKSLPKLSNLIWTCFVAIFSIKVLPRVPWRVGFFESFQNNQKIFKIPKLTKVVFKSVQTCFEHALRRFFRVFFAECSMQGFSNFLDLKIWGQFSGLKKFEFSFPDLKFEVDTLKKLKEKIKKVSKFWNCPKTFPSVQTCFGAIFLKMFFCPVFHGVIESIWKNQRHFKIAEMPKIFAKIVQLVLNMFCGNFLD